MGREQAEIDRSVAQSERDLARQPPDPSELIQHATALRKRIAATAADLARIEEEVARVHDELAAGQSSNSSEYRRAADQARKALRAREIERGFGRLIAARLPPHDPPKRPHADQVWTKRRIGSWSAQLGVLATYLLRSREPVGHARARCRVD